MSESVLAWVEKKFTAEDKANLRNHLWADIPWSFHMVHGVVREPTELNMIQSHNVTLHPFHEVLKSLCGEGERRFSASAGGDMAEIIEYYEKMMRKLA